MERDYGIDSLKLSISKVSALFTILLIIDRIAYKSTGILTTWLLFMSICITLCLFMEWIIEGIDIKICRQRHASSRTSNTLIRMTYVMMLYFVSLLLFKEQASYDKIILVTSKLQVFINVILITYRIASDLLGKLAKEWSTWVYK